MARKSKNVDWREVALERDGKTHTGHYEVTRGVITVTFGFKTKTTQVGGTPADVLAKILLSELVD